MNRELGRAQTDLWLLFGLCVACGRTDISDDFADEVQANGGATPVSTPRSGTGKGGGQGGSLKTRATGGSQWSGGSTTGGSRALGGTSTKGTSTKGTSTEGGTTARGDTSSGGRSTGDAGGVGARNVGGTSNSGGASGTATAGTTSRGGAGGVSGSDGVFRAGATSIGGTTSVGGVSGHAGTTNVAGRSGVAGAPPAVAGAGGSTGVAGAAGDSGFAGAAPCHPAPRTPNSGAAGAGNDAGAAGAGNAAGTDWYVDAVSGSDVAPGTQDQPLKSLGCASAVAMNGDTVNLLDGAWDPSIDPSLATTENVQCGSGAGIAFAPDVRLRAVHPGAARIIGFGTHGLCMAGGSIEGIRFVCPAALPVLETNHGRLTLLGDSFASCKTYGLAISGDADVTMFPGNLTDYAESGVDSFARVTDNGHLSIVGGTLTFSASALVATDDALLNLHAVTIRGSARPLTSDAIAVTGSPTLIVDGGSTIETVATGIDGSDFHGQIYIDGLTISNATRGLYVRNDLGTGAAATLDVNHLQVNAPTNMGLRNTGNSYVTIANSTFTHTGATAISLGGAGPASLTNVTISNSWQGLYGNSDPLGTGRSIKARNLQVTGSVTLGVALTSSIPVDYDFGTASDPGNNLFRDNNTEGGPNAANFGFNVGAMTISAIGNTWNANVQNADANGKYQAPSGSVLAPSTGAGINYYAGSTNIGKLLLAESP